eukprot:TRINITY_DN20769_c0_g1_i3.p1 TRINITY_DN20769_c0_g1~~TRINITY_DN20769_c0_g1_i3.p1  ORF type:complete len:449 (-),score=119.01 TRINITY_DN20769_c0_g1_i3:863-2092(-)
MGLQCSSCHERERPQGEKPVSASSRMVRASSSDADGTSSTGPNGVKHMHFDPATFRTREEFFRRYTMDGAFGDSSCFNDVMQEFWPALRGFLEKRILIGIVEPALQRHVWSHMRFEKCSLGDAPPEITGAKAHRISEENDERTVELALNTVFKGDQVDVILKVGKGIRASVTCMRISGTFCMQLKNFLPREPLISGLTVYFMNAPEVSITFGGMLGQVPTRVSLQKLIEKQIANCLVMPNRIALKLSEELDFYDLRHPIPAGVLEVTLQKVTKLAVSNRWLRGSLAQEAIHVRMKLAAEEWSSEALTVASEEVSWSDDAGRCTFFVDESHGQSLIVEVTRTGLGGSVIWQGQLRMSVANLANATKAEQTDWPVVVTPADEEDEPETIYLTLRGSLNPLKQGLSAARYVG